MSKDIEMPVESGREPGKAKVKHGRKPANPMGSSGAARHLEDDLQKNADTVHSTTQALIDEGFLPSRRLLDEEFLPNEIYDCLTRMDKKDSATKLKALNDFLQVITSEERDSIVNARTFWARFFVGFLEDDDPRVRELALKCQQQYVSILKKDIVPILARIIGPWWLSQYQMHSAAATAARASLHASFPDAKLTDLIKRFFSDIFTVIIQRMLPAPSKVSIHDRATKSTKSPAEPSNSTLLNDNQQLRIAEALDAFSGLVSSVAPATLDENQESVTQVLEKPEFWKLARLTSPKIRQNFCRFLSALWEKKPEFAVPYNKEAMNVVISNLHERDARAAVAIWELLLLILNKSPDWYKAADQKKTLMPKLLSLLKHGGFGVAANVFSSLIVLIDKLPDKSPETFDGIVSSLISGISVETLRTADSLAICQSICDCLRYMIKKSDVSATEAVIRTHSVPLMVNSLLGSGGSLKGLVDLQKLLLSWQNRGEAGAKLSSVVFGCLGDKLTYASPNVMSGPKVQQWYSSLVDAARKTVTESDKPRMILEKWIVEHRPFQDFLYHSLRLSCMLYTNSEDEDASSSFLVFLRLICSNTLYQRLKDFIEDQPTDQSPQLVILRRLMDSRPIASQLELFCILLCDCLSEENAREMFKIIWTNSTNHVSVVQAIEAYRGFEVVDRFFSASYTEELLSVAEGLATARDFPALGHALIVLFRVGADMDSVGMRLFDSIADCDLVTRLTFFRTFFGSSKSLPSTSEIIYKAITTAISVAGKLENYSESAENEIMDLITAMRACVAGADVDWTNHSVLVSVRTALETAAGPVVIEDLKKVLLALVGPATNHLVNMCSLLANFVIMNDAVLSRKDIFLFAITETEQEDLMLSHRYWDAEVEQAVATCCLVFELLSVELLLDHQELFTNFFRFAGTVTAYINVNFSSTIPAVHSHDILQSLQYYRKNLDTKCNSALRDTYLTTTAVNSAFGILFPFGAHTESAIVSATVNDFSETQLANVYACFHKNQQYLSSLGQAFRSEVRDCLENIFAFAEFPRSCEAIKVTSWSKIGPMRQVPVLLAERCDDPDFSSAILDVLGTVVIDWIACLSGAEITEENPKVFVLVQAAMDGVLSILKKADALVDSGILWVELTEFSFPRILASLLDGLFRFAETSEEYLTERHPVTGRLIATICALIQEFALRSQGILKPVWETMFNLEFGLPERLTVLHTSPAQMIPSLLQLFSPLLLHRVCHFQMAAADVFVSLIPNFPSCYTPQDFTSEHFPGPGKLLQSKEQDPPVETMQAMAPPAELLSVLEETADIVETMLQEVSLGTSFGGVIPQTDSYTYLVGYLMAWRCIFAWLKNETLEAKQAVAKHLELSGGFSALLDNLVRLLPLDVVYPERDQADTVSPGAKFRENYLSGFVPALTDVEEWSHPVYHTALEEMPMISRSWYSRKQGPVVRQIALYTAKFISPTVITHELAVAAGQARQVSFDNFKVNVRPTVAEITAEYRVEVWVAEIVIKIPKDYPLGNVKVAWGRTKGSARDAWDQWIIRLEGFLRRQNGTILDGILEWKKSVDRKFQGVEACAICLSIVDVKTAAVPQQRCKTCKNKFHTECLNRWFEQQVDPTCPLCREKFFT